MKGTPQALLETLQRLGLIPDGLGELYLYPSQARAIRQAGYSAVGTRMWMCPILPESLVAGTSYAHLSDALPRSYGRRPGDWRPYRAHLEGHPRGGYDALYKARTPAGARVYCPLCKKPNVLAEDNAHAHGHTDIVLSEARKHVAAAARALGYTLVPASTTHS